MLREQLERMMRFENFVGDFADAWANLVARARKRTRYASSAMRAVEALRAVEAFSPEALYTWAHVREAVAAVVVQSTVGQWTQADADAAHYHLRRAFGIADLPSAPPPLPPPPPEAGL